MIKKYLIAHPGALILYDSIEEAEASRNDFEQKRIMEVYFVKFSHQVLPDEEVA